MVCNNLNNVVIHKYILLKFIITHYLPAMVRLILDI